MASSPASRVTYLRAQPQFLPFLSRTTLPSKLPSRLLRAQRQQLSQSLSSRPRRARRAASTTTSVRRAAGRRLSTPAGLDAAQGSCPGGNTSEEPSPLQLAGRGEQRRQEQAVLLPCRLPADSKGSKAACSGCSEAGCSDRGFSQLCLGPACSSTSCAHPHAEASLTVARGEGLQRAR